MAINGRIIHPAHTSIHSIIPIWAWVDMRRGRVGQGMSMEVYVRVGYAR